MRQLIAGICLCISICFGWNGAPYPCDTKEVETYLKNWTLPYFINLNSHIGHKFISIQCKENSLKLEILYPKSSKKDREVLNELANKLVCNDMILRNVFDKIPVRVVREHRFNKITEIEGELSQYCNKDMITHNSNIKQLCNFNLIDLLVNIESSIKYNKPEIIQCENNAIVVNYNIYKLANLKTLAEHNEFKNNAEYLASKLICNEKEFNPIKQVANGVIVRFVKDKYYFKETDLKFGYDIYVDFSTCQGILRNQI